MAVLNTVRCWTGSQCNFLSTLVLLVYLLVFDTILAALFWIYCNLHRLNLGEAPEKWVAVIQLTTNKNISHKSRSIMSKKPHDMSEIRVSQNFCRHSEHAWTRINLWTAQDINWKTCFQLVPLSLQTKDDKLSLVRIQFELTS